jgi:hypothetical protein
MGNSLSLCLLGPLVLLRGMRREVGRKGVELGGGRVDVSCLNGARGGLPAVGERPWDGHCRYRSQGNSRDERYSSGTKPIHV